MLLFGDRTLDAVTIADEVTASTTERTVLTDGRLRIVGAEILFALSLLLGGGLRRSTINNRSCSRGGGNGAVIVNRVRRVASRGS